MTDITLPWIVVADRYIARLMEASVTEHGRLHLEERSVITDEWEHNQHGRPSPRAGKDGHSYASEPHEFEERTRRFAREFVDWVKTERDSRKIERLEVFMSSRFLGFVRKQVDAAPWTTHECDLAQLKPGELAQHRNIEALFDDKDLRTSAS